MSGLLEHGDEILKVDGAAVTTETLAKSLVGSDIPGTMVEITVKKVQLLGTTSELSQNDKIAQQSSALMHLRLRFAICKSFPALILCYILLESLGERWRREQNSVNAHEDGGYCRSAKTV